MTVRVLRAAQAELLGPPDGARERFLLAAADTGGRSSLVEHHAPPGTLTAPLHRHIREDEVSLGLEGRKGAVSDGEEVEAGAGDLVWKPRNAWHNFCNGGNSPLRVLEVITRGGLDDLFLALDRLEDVPDPDELGRMAAPFGVELDLDGTMTVLERHGLRL